MPDAPVSTYPVVAADGRSLRFRRITSHEAIDPSCFVDGGLSLRASLRWLCPRMTDADVERGVERSRQEWPDGMPRTAAALTRVGLWAVGADGPALARTPFDAVDGRWRVEMERILTGRFTLPCGSTMEGERRAVRVMWMADARRSPAFATARWAALAAISEDSVGCAVRVDPLQAMAVLDALHAWEDARGGLKAFRKAARPAASTAYGDVFPAWQLTAALAAYERARGLP